MGKGSGGVGAGAGGGGGDFKRQLKESDKQKVLLHLNVYSPNGGGGRRSSDDRKKEEEKGRGGDKRRSPYSDYRNPCVRYC